MLYLYLIRNILKILWIKYKLYITVLILIVFASSNMVFASTSAVCDAPSDEFQSYINFTNEVLIELSKYETNTEDASSSIGSFGLFGDNVLNIGDAPDRASAVLSQNSKTTINKSESDRVQNIINENVATQNPSETTDTFEAAHKNEAFAREWETLTSIDTSINALIKRLASDKKYELLIDSEVQKKMDEVIGKYRSNWESVLIFEKIAMDSSAKYSSILDSMKTLNQMYKDYFSWVFAWDNWFYNEMAGETTTNKWTSNEETTKNNELSDRSNGVYMVINLEYIKSFEDKYNEAMSLDNGCNQDAVNTKKAFGVIWELWSAAVDSRNQIKTSFQELRDNLSSTAKNIWTKAKENRGTSEWRKNTLTKYRNQTLKYVYNVTDDMVDSFPVNAIKAIKKTNIMPSSWIETQIPDVDFRSIDNVNTEFVSFDNVLKDTVWQQSVYMTSFEKYDNTAANAKLTEISIYVNMVTDLVKGDLLSSFGQVCEYQCSNKGNEYCFN